MNARLENAGFSEDDVESVSLDERNAEAPDLDESSAEAPDLDESSAEAPDLDESSAEAPDLDEGSDDDPSAEAPDLDEGSADTSASDAARTERTGDWREKMGQFAKSTYDKLMATGNVADAAIKIGAVTTATGTAIYHLFNPAPASDRPPEPPVEQVATCEQRQIKEKFHLADGSIVEREELHQRGDCSDQDRQDDTQ